jgi:hypothetical protein
MKLPAAALTVLALAACNSQNKADANRTAAGGSPAGTSGGPASSLQPGRWEMTMRVVSLEVPNAAPETAEQLRAQPMPPPQMTPNCVTPQEASDFVGNFRRQLVQNNVTSCDLGDQQFGNGRIRISMTCRAQNGPEQRLVMVGSFTETSIQAAVTAASSMPVNGAMQSVRIESTLTGRRVGECNGTETG